MRGVVFAIALFCAGICASPAAAAKRVALLIGNGAYAPNDGSA